MLVGKWCKEAPACTEWPPNPLRRRSYFDPLQMEFEFHQNLTTTWNATNFWISNVHYTSSLDSLLIFVVGPNFSMTLLKMIWCEKEVKVKYWPGRTSSAGNPSSTAFGGSPLAQTPDRTGPDCHIQPGNLKIDQIVISNLEVRTNLNSRQQLGNNIISGNFLYILYICLQYPTFILTLCSKSMSMNMDSIMMWWCFDEINQDDNSYQVPLKLHQFDKVLRLLQFGRKLLDDCPHLYYSSYSDTCIIIMYKYKCMVYYIWQWWQGSQTPSVWSKASYPHMIGYLIWQISRKWQCRGLYVGHIYNIMIYNIYRVSCILCVTVHCVFSKIYI